MATYRNGETNEVRLYIMEPEEEEASLAFIRRHRPLVLTGFQRECDHAVVMHDGRCAFCKVDYRAWQERHAEGRDNAYR